MQMHFDLWEKNEALGQFNKMSSDMVQQMLV